MDREEVAWHRTWERGGGTRPAAPCASLAGVPHARLHKGHHTHTQPPSYRGWRLLLVGGDGPGRGRASRGPGELAARRRRDCPPGRGPLRGRRRTGPARRAGTGGGGADQVGGCEGGHGVWGGVWGACRRTEERNGERPRSPPFITLVFISHTRLLASEAITPKKSRARAHATTPTQLHPQNMLGTVTLGGRLAAPRASAPPSTSAPRGQASPARASLLRPPLNAPLRRAAPAPRRGRAGLACRAMFERFTEVSGAGAGGVGVRGRGSVPRRTRLESRETFPFPLRPAPLWPARAFGGGGGGAVCELGGPRAEAAQPPLLACGATALAPAGRWGACEEGGAGRRAAPGNRAGLRRLPRTTRASVLASE